MRSQDEFQYSDGTPLFFAVKSVRSKILIITKSVVTQYHAYDNAYVFLQKGNKTGSIGNIHETLKGMHI